MIYGLHVVVLVQHIQDAVDFFDVVLIGEFHPGLGNHGHIGGSHGNAGRLQGLAHLAEGIILIA